VLERAALAAKPRHAALKHPAHQELLELALDELREADTVAGLDRRAQERVQVLGDDLMEHGVVGVSRAIHGLGTRHPCGYRASSDPPMARDGYARSRVPGATGVAARGTASGVWAARARGADGAVSACFTAGWRERCWRQAERRTATSSSLLGVSCWRV